MNAFGLSPHEIDALQAVFRKYSDIQCVLVFGSRAKGTFRKESDIDLAVSGITDELRIEALANELDELPLPYLFDVKSLDNIRNPALRDHVERVGRAIYPPETHHP